MKDPKTAEHPDAPFDDIPAAAAMRIDLRAYLKAVESGLIREALLASNGVVAHAAARLGLRRTTLADKLRRQGLGAELLAARRREGSS